MKAASTEAIELLKEFGIDYSKSGILTDPKYYVNGEGHYSCYRYFTNNDLETDLDIKSSK